MDVSFLALGLRALAAGGPSAAPDEVIIRKYAVSLNPELQPSGVRLAATVGGTASMSRAS